MTEEYIRRCDLCRTERQNDRGADCWDDWAEVTISQDPAGRGKHTRDVCPTCVGQIAGLLGVYELVP